jgi:hypothetical protein
LERDHLNQFAVVDVLSGDYEVGEDDDAACLKIQDRRPDALLFGIRVGHETAYKFGMGKIGPSS